MLIKAYKVSVAMDMGQSLPLSMLMAVLMIMGMLMGMSVIMLMTVPLALLSLIHIYGRSKRAAPLCRGKLQAVRRSYRAA